MSIESDSVVFNKAKGTAVYEGQVVVAQGTLKITAQRLEIQAPNNDVNLIQATGGPVTFKQKMDDGKMAVGQAKKLQYWVKKKRLSLSGNARLTQNKDTFTSDFIEYSTVTGELKAGTAKGQTQNKGRVKAIFYPSGSGQ